MLNLVLVIDFAGSGIGYWALRVATGNQDLPARTEQTASNVQEAAATMM